MPVDIPKIRDHAMKMISLFGSTYRYALLFSQIKNVKSKARTTITDMHLENSLIATTTFGRLIKNK